MRAPQKFVRTVSAEIRSTKSRTQHHFSIGQRVFRPLAPDDPGRQKPAILPVQVGVLAVGVGKAPAADAADIGAVLVPPGAEEGHAAVGASVVSC